MTHLTSLKLTFAAVALCTLACLSTQVMAQRISVIRTNEETRRLSEEPSRDISRRTETRITHDVYRYDDRGYYNDRYPYDPSYQINYSDGRSSISIGTQYPGYDRPPPGYRPGYHRPPGHRPPGNHWYRPEPDTRPAQRRIIPRVDK